MVVIRLLDNAAECGSINPVPRSGQSSAVVVKRLREKAASSRQRKHKQPVIQAAQAQASSYTSSASTGNQLYQQRKHKQPVIQAANAQATSYICCLR